MYCSGTERVMQRQGWQTVGVSSEVAKLEHFDLARGRKAVSNDSGQQLIFLSVVVVVVVVVVYR